MVAYVAGEIDADTPFQEVPLPVAALGWLCALPAAILDRGGLAVWTDSGVTRIGVSVRLVQPGTSV